LRAPASQNEPVAGVGARDENRFVHDSLLCGDESRPLPPEWCVKSSRGGSLTEQGLEINSFPSQPIRTKG
jgi:hypothetical protein